ncbi:MAG TPA: NUDIX domain-containing protein [Nocardioidaceae bacterium]|nr:NUDIX domain-containing protein [Nocardioidaceae bacterium]
MAEICVGAVIRDAAGRLLMVRRGHPPSEGSWSIPGGRVEPGESLEHAVRREVTEETGLAVEVGRVAGRADIPGAGSSTYDVTDFFCTAANGAEVTAGDDAAEVRWVTRAEIDALQCSPGLVAHLDSWGIWRSS